MHTEIQADPITQQIKTILNSEKETLYINSGNCKADEKFIRTISEIKRSDQTVVFKLVVPNTKK